MTSLDGFGQSLSDSISSRVTQSFARRVRGAKQSTPDTTFFQDTLHLLGKPEEITSKLIGQVFSDDPKYDDAFGSSDFWSQIGFFELARDAGINQENLGTFGPALAAVVGLGAAIANPLDPLNKLKVLGLTKKGIGIQKASQAADIAGESALILHGGKDVKPFYQINKAELAENLSRRKKDIEKVTDPSIIKNEQKNIRALESQSKNIDSTNKLLKQLQEQGLSIKDIRLAPTTFERIRSGQQHLLGFGSPLSLDHLSFLGLGRKDIDRASVASIVPLPKRYQASFVDKISNASAAVKGKAVEVGQNVIEKAGFNVARQAKTREALARIKQLIQTSRGEEALYNDLVHSLRKELKLTDDELLEVVDKLEDQFIVDKQVLKDIISRTAGQPDPLVFKTGKDVKEVFEGEGPTIAGSRITEDERILLTPSGLDEANDIPKAVAQFRDSKYPNWPLRDGAGGEIKVTGEFVIYKPSSAAQAESDLGSINRALGVRSFKKVKTEAGEEILVARRLPGSVPMRDASMFDSAHLQNLGVFLAKLGTRQKTVKGLKPEDILVNPLGGIQLVNPDVVVDAKSSANALAQSRLALDQFVDQYTSIPRGKGQREVQGLKSVEAAKRAPREFTPRRVATGVEGARFYNVHDLLSDAVNAAPERDILRGVNEGMTPAQIAEITKDRRDFLRANGIEDEANRMLTQIRNGELPTMEPVVVTKDANNNLHIVYGHERAAAAAMIGMDTVPITVREGFGESLNLTRGVYTGRTLGIKEFFHTPEGRTHSGQANRGLMPEKRAVVSNDYKIVSEDGKQFTRLSNKSAFETESSQSVLAALGELSTVGLVASSGRLQRPGLLISKLNKVFNDRSGHTAAAAISDLVASSKDHVEFAERLHELTSALSNRNNIARHANSPEVLNAYNKLKSITSKNLEELAANGILCNNCVSDPKLREILLRNIGDRTGMFLEADKNTITFANLSRDGKFIREFADQAMLKVGGADEIAPLGKIRLVSSDGEKILEVRDLVKHDTHPKLSNFIDKRTQFNISDETLANLEKEHGILKNPKDLPYMKEAPLRTDGARRQPMPFIITKSGDLFVSTRHQDVPALLYSIFGDGPIYAQELGVISPRGINLSNPLGSLMEKVGPSEIRALERRVKVLASRFEELGLSGGTRIDITVPFDNAVWRSMYGEYTTIDDILKRGWKLNIPEILKDMPLDVSLETSEIVVAIRQPRFSNPNQQKLFDFLNESFDEQFVEEFKKGVSRSYWASYFPRLMTNDAQEAFNEAGLEFIKAHPEMARHLEPFTKQRVLTDWTVNDFNRAIEVLRANKVEEPERLLEGIIEILRDKFGKDITPERARRFNKIVETLPEGVKFFHDDPLHAAKLRFAQGRKAILRSEVLQTLKDSGAIWTGSAAQYKALLLGREATFKPIEEALQDVATRRARIQGQLDILNSTPDAKATKRVEDLTKELDKIDVEEFKLNAEKSEKYKLFAGKNGTIADSIEGNKVFIAGDDAQRLVEDGLISIDDIPKGLDDSLVSLDFGKVASVLEGRKLEVILFNPESAVIAERFFGLESKKGFNSFLKAWDYVHDLWRTWTLFPIPAFHVRNAVSNFTMAWLGGVTNPDNYEQSLRIFKVLRQRRAGQLTVDQANKALEGILLPNSIGQVVNAREVFEEFVHRGGLSGGFFVNEFSRYGSQKFADDATRAAVKLGGLVPASEAAGNIIVDNSLIRGGMRAGSAIESRFRMAAFLDSWKKTGSFDQAEMTMKAIFYDYSDMSAFERATLRRVIPFWSWARHNTSRMLQTMLTDPVKHIRILRFIHQVEQGATNRAPVDENDIEPWVRNNFGFALYKGKDGKYFMKTAEGLFPMFDVYKLLSGGIVGTALKSVTPFGKFPIEQIANHSFFTGGNLENFPGEPTRKRTLGFLGLSKRVTTQGPLGVANLILNESVLRDFFRLGNTAANFLDDLIDPKNWIDGEPTLQVAAWDLLLGRGRVIDPERTRAIAQFKKREFLSSLRRAEKYYEETGNDWLLDEVRQRKMNFLLEFGSDK